MIRDGAFCLGFLGFTPILERELQSISSIDNNNNSNNNDNSTFKNKDNDKLLSATQSTVIAGLCSGFLAGSSTHMFDTGTHSQ